MSKWLGKISVKIAGLAFLALGLNIVLPSLSFADFIMCGKAKCETEHRRCVKLDPSPCKTWSTITAPNGMASTTCIEYEYYRCIGKNETNPKNSTAVTSSVDNSGKALTGDAEKKALTQAKEAEYTAYEKNELVGEYYSKQEKVFLDKRSKDLLDKAKKAEEDDEYWFEQNDTQDALDWIAKLEDYTTRLGYDEGLGSPGDTRIKDAIDDAIDNLLSVKNDGYLTEEEYNELCKAIGELGKIALERAKNASTYTREEKKVEQLQEEIAEVQEEIIQRCPTTEQYMARYSAGCWSCLVIEKLTSAFLHAADKGLKVTQRAGMVLLWLGTAIWLVFWGLKNVSSFTQIQLGNILNDLLKFLFKVALAYWFITYSSTLISEYFITPIMSVGAKIGQEFWSQDIKDYTQEWEFDEFIDDDDPLNDGAETEQKDKQQASGGGSGSATATTASAPAEEPQTPVEEPHLVEPSSEEELVQSLQKAFIAVLEQQWKEVTNSCGPSKNAACGKSCKSFTTCNKADKSHAKGHIDYVVNEIMAWAGYKGNNHYCQASVTAGMKKLASRIGKTENGKKLLNILNGAGAGCALGYSMFGYSASQDIQICENKKLIYNKINVADTIWIHGNKGTNQKFGGGSGHHAVTALDNKGNILSFNGDSRWNLCTTYPNLIGKVGCISCKFRELLKNHPELKNELDTQELAKLAAGYNVSFINYEGGAYSNVGSGAGTAVNYDSLIVSIPEVKYSGPKNILPASVMNSILGAIRAITNTTANNMVLGNAIMCYSTLKDGGAWVVKLAGIEIASSPNFIMWTEGAIIWCLGFLLTLAVAYYFLDISFKIGFAVLSIPVVMGLWPFGMTQGKLYIAISIIAKSAALFAFLALTTYFGMELISESISAGGLEGENGLYTQLNSIFDRSLTEEEEDEMQEAINAKLSLFSSTFILLMFAIIYSYKLVQQTSSDLVNKFFPDQAFGDSSPMHSAATMMTSWAKNFAMKASGANLAKDIVANQAGVLAKNMVRHPIKNAKSVAGGAAKAAGGIAKGAKAAGGAIKGGLNKLRGK